MECVNYLHHKQICHRDLKPQNIMFLNDEPNSIIKIIDYGYSFNFMIKKEDLNEVLGTPYYMAPELFSGKYNEKWFMEYRCNDVLFYMFKLPF